MNRRPIAYTVAAFLLLGPVAACHSSVKGHGTPVAKASAAPAPSSLPPVVGGDVRSSAGIQPGHVLRTVSGDVDVSSSISDEHITGNMYVNGSNLSITNVRVDGIVIVNSARRTPPPTNVRLVHVDLQAIYTYGFDGLTVDSANVHGAKNESMSQFFDYGSGGPGSAETIPARNLVMTNSWWHDQQPSTNQAHLQCIHTSGVQGAVFRNNRFELIAPDQNTLTYVSAIFFEEPQLYRTYDKDFTIDRNIFIGGSYYLVSIEPTGTSSVTNNQFSAGPNNPRFTGSVNTDPKSSGRAPTGGFPRFTDSGNTLDGKPITLANGR